MSTAVQAAALYAPVIKTLSDKFSSVGGGRSLSAAELHFVLHNDKSGNITSNDDGTYGVAGFKLSVFPDGSMKLVMPDAIGRGTLSLVLSDQNKDGRYEASNIRLDSSLLSKAEEAIFEEVISNLLNNDDVYGGRKKKGGGVSGGGFSAAASNSESWFIQVAEGMGEVLNSMANDLSRAIDRVRTRNGQPPFKDAMRIQGLAQQLGFVSNALMTALNSIGEAIKTSVTAGGAAR